MLTSASFTLATIGTRSQGSKGHERAGLEQEVSIEEIAPKYMILHAKAFQMQSAQIPILAFRGAGLEQGVSLEETAPLYMI